MADTNTKTTEDLLRDVSSELVRVSDDFTRKAEEAMTEVKNAGKLSTETKGAVDEMAVKQSELTGIVNEMKTRLGEVEQQGARRGGQPDARVKTIGNQLVASDKVEPFAKALHAGQRLSVPVTDVQNALVSTGVAEGVVAPDRQPGILMLPKPRLFIRDLVTPGRTGAAAIFWVQQTGFVNNAAAVAENTKKPESTITFEPKITPVATIAHLFKASKQILDDFAQLASTVDAETRFGLKQAEEREMLFGTGIGVHLHGFVPQAQAFDPAFIPDHRTNIDDLRLAMLQTQIARLPATGFVLHFMDWAKTEMSKDANGGYIFANPLSLAGPVLWGLPVVATDTPEMQGEFLTGAFQAGAQLFDREDANVVISTENVDDFEKNMITIRCEERLALAIKRPEAFVTGPFGAPSAP